MNFPAVFKTVLTMFKRYKFHKGNPGIKTKREMGDRPDECLMAMPGVDPA
jgi:hypothetical protein